MDFQEYASRNPELTFIHAFPGFVHTPLLTRDKPILGRLLAPLASCLATKPEVRFSLVCTMTRVFL